MRHYLSRIFHKNPNGLTLEQITEKVINLERISRNAPGLYENKNDVWHVGNAVCKGMMFKEKKEGYTFIIQLKIIFLGGSRFAT